MSIGSYKEERRLGQIVGWDAEVRHFVGEFFHGDKTKVDAWMTSANPILGGVSPQYMILIGRGKVLVKFVRDCLEENKR